MFAGRDRLSGRVEVDETFTGGEHPGVRGRGALGKTLVAVAVELNEPRGFGRARLHRGHRRPGFPLTIIGVRADDPAASAGRSPTGASHDRNAVGICSSCGARGGSG